MVLFEKERNKAMGKNKIEFLKKEGILNQKPDRVLCKKFQELDFFDPLDLPQVRYEMLRSARVEKNSVAEACRKFGFSREYFYRLERGFIERGYASLLGSRKGRRPIIALNQEIVNFCLIKKNLKLLRDNIVSLIWCKKLRNPIRNEHVRHARTRSCIFG